MTPDIDLRLSTMVRALEQVVIPALDPRNGLACEQAGLLVGQLRLLASQWHRTEKYAAVCLADLARSLADLAPQGGPTTQGAQARVVACAEDTGLPSLEAQYKALSRHADALVRAADIDGEPAFRTALHRALLAFSQRQALRDRSWFALSGFDFRPDELIPMEQLVGESAQ